MTGFRALLLKWNLTQCLSRPHSCFSKLSIVGCGVWITLQCVADKADQLGNGCEDPNCHEDDNRIVEHDVSECCNVPVAAAGCEDRSHHNARQAEEANRRGEPNTATHSN